ncbi:helix-turn-helix domain-containing protein [Dyadobacter sp. 32]|uniref:helix-turn-helix domain-containing protein n=1 Tax=Dyadobacter sp. 32 TaxID=538966 RepID=UPI0011EF20E6
MKKKTPDSCSHNPNTNSTRQTVAPVKIRSDPAASSDHFIDVNEAKLILKTVSAQKLYYHCANGHLPFIRQAGKLYFSEAVLRLWHDRIESRKHCRVDR